MTNNNHHRLPDGHYDVVVSGFGPVGQVAANLLGQRNYRVAVFETATSIATMMTPIRSVIRAP